MPRERPRFVPARSNSSGTVLTLDVDVRGGIETRRFVVPGDAHQIVKELTCEASTGLRRIFGLTTPVKILEAWVLLPDSAFGDGYAAERLTSAERDFLLSLSFPVEEIFEQISAKYTAVRIREAVARQRVSEEAEQAIWETLPKPLPQREGAAP